MSSLETTLDLLREARNSQSTDKDGIPYRDSTKDFALVLVVKYVWTGHDAALNGAVKVITDALEETGCHEGDVAQERRTEASIHPVSTLALINEFHSLMCRRPSRKFSTTKVKQQRAWVMF